MTDRITHVCTCEDLPAIRVAATAEPSTELLDRAHAGWERFVRTFEGASDD
ncbi:hypothetical protein [Streptomyces sp. NPDC059708]|uniref:hypothetical protein n=1 Tax=Streptomyces sp. NPDC059708 TaxID=3346916 RepID=UPI0036C2151C